MACYNGRNYILDQMDSIRNQTHRADECIIVDDCSGDGTADIVSEYMKEHRCSGWRLVRNGHNTGYVKAFEKAMSLCGGDIIFLADQDDIWIPNKIEIMSHAMCKYPRILSLCTGFSGIDAEGNPLPVRSPVLTENHGLILLRHMKQNGLYQLGFRDILQRNTAMGCTMAVRRKLIRIYQKSPHTENMPHDWKLNFLASLENGLFFLNREMLSYRIHPRNTIGMKTDGSQISREYRIREYQRYISSYGEMKKILDALLPKDNAGDVLMEKIVRTERFYCGRVNALEKKDVLQTAVLSVKYFPHFGLYAASALMDILPPPDAAGHGSGSVLSDLLHNIKVYQT